MQKQSSEPAKVADCRLVQGGNPRSLYQELVCSDNEDLDQDIRELDLIDPFIRAEKINLDKTAPIRDIFQKLVTNFPNNFTPNSQLILDEQLIAFRGRCKFRQSIPKKLAKYGIKIFVLVDYQNLYT